MKLGLTACKTIHLYLLHVIHNLEKIGSFFLN